MKRLLAVLLLLFAPAAFAQPATPKPKPAIEQAIFAGGCFWCVEHDFAKIPGVVDAVSGYTGGDRLNPTYENHDGFYEAVQVSYDPAKVSYAQLVERFWRLVDPTDAGGQFCDRGDSYRTAIFVTPAQAPVAQASKAALIRSGVVKDPIVTPIVPIKKFWIAEDYHQDYAKKNPIRYNFYRNGCGRDARVREVWGAQAGK